MSPQLIVTLINVALLILVILGFLIGLKGVKKSLWGLGSFAIGFALVLIFTPLLSKLLLRISINGASLESTISTAIIDALGEEYASNEFVKEAVSNYPLLIVNLVSYIVLMFVLMGLIKLLSAIVYKIINSKKNKQVKEECKIINGKPQMVVVKEKEKKYRLLGGLVKAVETFMFLLLLIMPINGLVKTFNQIVGSTTVSAESSNQSLSDTIKENIPNEVLDIMSCYQDSIFFKISDVGNMNTAMLNQVASVKVNGQVVRLGDELNALVIIYDDYNYAMSLDFSKTETLKQIDFDRVRNFIRTISNMGTFKAFFEDGVKMALTEWKVEAGTTEYVAKQATQDVLDNYSLSNFTDDLLSVVDIVETAVKEGLVDEFLKDDVNIDAIMNILSKENEKVSKKLVNSIFGINLLNKSIISFTNVGIYELEQELKTTEGLENISIPRVKVKDASINPIEINSILSNVYKVYNELAKLNTIDAETNKTIYFYNNLESDPYKCLSKGSEENNNYSVYTVMSTIGDIYNGIYSLEYLNNNNTLLSLFEALDGYNEVSKYVSLSVLKNSIKHDFNCLATAVDLLVKADAIDALTYSEVESTSSTSTLDNSETSNEDKLDFKKILNGLITNTNDGKTYINVILNNLFDIKSIRPSVSYIFGELTNKINEFFDRAVKEQERGYEVVTKFIETALISDNQTIKENEIGKLAEIVELLAKLEETDMIENAQDGKIAKILETVELESLGKMLQNIKELTLLSDYSEDDLLKDGVYKSFVKEYLAKTELNEYIDFAPTVRDSYSWYDELRPLTTTELENNKHNVNSFVNYIKDIKVINSENVEVSLIEFLLNSNSDYNDLINQLTTEQLNAIIDNVFDIEILKPISVMLTNVVNQSIKSIVSKTLEGVDIPEIDEIPDDQIEDVKKVLTSVTEILNDVKDNEDVKDENGNIDFTKVDIAKIDAETMTNIIVALDENAQKDNGVLKDTYNTVKDYLKTELGDITTEDGKTLTEIITDAETNDTRIDWSTIAPELIEKYKNSLS